MSIASAGDNSLMLLARKPKEMLCLDMNETQIWLTQLKEQAIKHLSHEEFLQLMGFLPCDYRLEIYIKIHEELSEEARTFFTPERIENGIIHQGKFEKYFQLFAKKIVPWIHNKNRVNDLFEGHILEDEAYEHFYHSEWNTWRWRLFFKVFFSRYVMGKFGREPEKLKEVKGNVGKRIFAMAEKHLISHNRISNYMLEYTLKGEFDKNFPPYAQEAIFPMIKKWLQTNSIKYFHGDLEQCLNQHPDFNRFNLSNIFEYMHKEDFEDQAKLLYKKSASDSVFSYWNLMVPRAFDSQHFQRQESDSRDFGFFYQEFHNYIKAK